MLYVVLSHLAPVGTCILTDLYWLGVNTEDRLSSIYRLSYLTGGLCPHVIPDIWIRIDTFVYAVMRVCVDLPRKNPGASVLCFRGKVLPLQR